MAFFDSDINVMTHPVYLELIKTGLFLDITPDKYIDLTQMRRLSFLADPRFIVNIIVRSEQRYYLGWHLLDSYDLKKAKSQRMSFEEVFEYVSKETKNKILWHLDLFLKSEKNFPD